MNKSGLLVRLAVVIGFASIAIGLLSTQLFYRLTVNKEIGFAHQSIDSLYKTVEATAATAAYLAEKDLAQEVIDGLITNDIVLNASMSFEETVVRTHEQPLNNPIAFPIKSLFEPNKTIGQLLIEPNVEFIELRASQLATENSNAMVLQALVVTIVSIFVAFFLITRPIIAIAKALHHTRPGEGKRLMVPEFHDGSELGLLVRDVNELLDKTESQFNQERKLREEIEALEKRFRMLFENSLSPIILMEPGGNILLFNSAFEKVLNKLDLQLRKSFGPLLKDLFDDPDSLSRVVEVAFANEEIATGEFKLKTEDGNQHFWVQVVVTAIISEDMREYYQVTLHDISKRKRELDDLAYQADFDKLTKMLNRQGLEKQLTTLMTTQSRFMLVLLDLNWFKQVNDIYGHKAGDEILIFVADRIKKTLRPEDFGGRWGGDEFVLLLSQADQSETREIVTRLVNRISKPFYLRNFEQNVTIGASVGAASYPDDSLDLQTLLHLADKAMYQSKKLKETQPEHFLHFSEETQQVQVNHV
ncbi:sensor domain-containing diguanylate cyclase [Planctobacterium marinum]|uniref:sensor domain-containing diguanylate cyclase n=1 Tax=Planctobacterium marinum TaxID=1631968 RepID=UPI001E3DA540|nr:sensor domain-containing diguanylate cyclase [Planctobacterium marinum]MCC2604264.1 diguanylate cyclase [Planctobacterium marinum]